MWIDVIERSDEPLARLVGRLQEAAGNGDDRVAPGVTRMMLLLDLRAGRALRAREGVDKIVPNAHRFAGPTPIVKG
jgi:hypothetical protein